jgi:hypothetical protein
VRIERDPGQVITGWQDGQLVGIEVLGGRALLLVVAAGDGRRCDARGGEEAAVTDVENVVPASLPSTRAATRAARCGREL